MPTLVIDNREVPIPDGATILDAARAAGIEIPTLCHKPGIDPNTSCMLCVVKVDGRPRLVPSCATKAAPGMKVENDTPEIRSSRRMALELLLSDHAGDCLAPCTNVCPAHMDIPKMIRHIQDGQLHEALVIVKEAIALPAVLGRICPELCEKGCRRSQIDAPASICELKRYVADTDLALPQPWLPPRREATGKKIAIVGTGPAGLAAAYYLQQLGHQSVLFDEHPLPGGNLRYGVPEEKLPRDVLDAEINIIRKLGAIFEMDYPVGKKRGVTDLRGEFDAVILAVGEVNAAKAAGLGIAMLGKGLKTDKSTLMTPLPGVFAAGGALLPLKHAVRAVADGRDVAQIVDQYVRGVLPAADKPSFTVRLGVLTEQELGIFQHAAPATPRQTAGATGLSDAQAAAEAERCLHCDCEKLDGCKLRRYAVEYEAAATHYKTDRKQYERVESHEAVVYEPGKCIACGLCVSITSKHQEPLGLTFVGRGFSVRVAAPFNEKMSAALQKVAEEVCASCPTAALTLKHRP